MKLKVVLGFVAVTGFIFSSMSASAQCKGWNWPEDKAAAEEKNVLLTDDTKAKQWRKAVPSFQWLYTTAPKLNTSIYQRGEKIYDNLAKVEKDPVRKQELVDSLLWIYDQRIANCGQEGKVLDKKTFAAYKYYIKSSDTAKTRVLYNLFEKTVKMNGNSMSINNARGYMYVAAFGSTKLKMYGQEGILERYDVLSDIIAHNIANGSEKYKSKWEDTQKVADGILHQVVKLDDCEKVKKTFGERFTAEPDNAKVNKWVFTYLLANKCTSDPMWVEAAQRIVKTNPDKKLYEVLGNKALQEGDYATAEEYLNKGLAMSEDDASKANFHKLLGHLALKKGSKSTARAEYRKALSLNPSENSLHTKIGNLYYNSYNTCKKGEDKVLDRLVFIAAYDEYKKAGNSSMMAKMKEQFPSVEEMFQRNYSKGESKTLGCWINTTVVLDTRD